MNRYKWAAIVAAAAIMGNPAAWGDAGLARHKKLYAVPAPGKVTIDGKFDDWDLSGRILMYVDSATAEMESAKFALMYDDEAIYLGAEVRDPTPLRNRHDPKVTGYQGWNADSCQFRLTLDPQIAYPVPPGEKDNPNLATLTLWYYTDDRLPCLTLHSTMKFLSPRKEWEPFGVVPPELFEAKYLPMEDGGGYTFEYRIPWSTLGAKAPLKGGDLVAGTVQFNWSYPDGLTTSGAWAYDVMAGPGFTFQNAGVWGKIIFSEKGNLPKEIVEEGVSPERPLPLRFAYELPEESQITIQLMNESNTLRRILVAQGNRPAGRNVESWDGLDSTGKLLPPGRYTWKGIYHEPLRQKFLFSPHNSGQPPYVTDDGKGAWGGDHGGPTDVCAFNEGVILCWSMCEAGFGIIRTDFNGRKQWGSRDRANHLATDGARLFFSGNDNRQVVRLLDLADSRPILFGNGKPTLPPPADGAAASNAVSGLAFADGVLYVAYHDRNLIGVFDAASGDLKATWAVPAPERLAARPDGSLAAVSEGKVLALETKGGTWRPLLETHLDNPRGIAAAPDGTIYAANAGVLQNVSVFDAAGKYLRSIGKEGGRPAVGRYDPSGIYQPGGIAMDKEGQLWVTETTDSPKRVSVWASGAGTLVNEFFGSSGYHGHAWIDPSRPDEIYCHNTIWKIDWEKNACEPYSTLWRSTAPGVWGFNAYKSFTARNGRQYGIQTAMFAADVTQVARRDGDVYKPFLGIVKGHLWQDANDDQMAQDDELLPLPNPNTTTFKMLDYDLNVWLSTRHFLKPVKVEADGRPVYDPAQPVETAFVKDGPGRHALWQDPADNAIYGYNENAWLARWTMDGQMAWRYPDMLFWPAALGLPMQTPGTLYAWTQGVGVAGDFFGVAAYFGTFHLVHRDGVYVGMLMRDGRDGKGLGPDRVASETFTGSLVKLDNLPGSEGRSRYFLMAGAGDARVTEIFGLDTVKPLPGGTVELTEADIKVAAEAYSGYQSALAKSHRLSIARGKSGLATAASISKVYGGGRRFSVHAAYDETNVYLSFGVESPSDLINAHPDAQMVFKGGNCLDIQIAVDPDADPARKTPAPGDVRLLVTRQADPADAARVKPLAVLYRPKIKGFAGEPIVMTSPTGSESFDAIEVRDDIGLAYGKTPAGFSATVTIPQAALGLALKPGRMLTMDVGYIYGNATGNDASARSYWVNNSFTANVLHDIPHESRLEPAEWGTAVVE